MPCPSPCAVVGAATNLGNARESSVGGVNSGDIPRKSAGSWPYQVPPFLDVSMSYGNTSMALLTRLALTKDDSN